MLLDTLNFYSISMKDKANWKHVLERKYYWLLKNLNRNCEKNPQSFHVQGYLLRNRGNCCLSMVPSFKSSVARLNFKILTKHYYGVKLQEKWLYKNAIAKKLFRFCYTLGCNRSSNSEKFTFGLIMKFLKKKIFIVPQNSF